MSSSSLLSGQEQHKQNVLNYLEIKRNSRLGKRCEACWHDPRNCICSRLPAVNLHKNINFVVYIDSKEMWNAGDDAKLLKIVSPEQTKMFVYAGHDEELVQYISTKNSSDVVVLFPSDYAISFWEFVEIRNAAQTSQKVPTTSDIESSSNFSSELTIIVVNAVWRHARRMAARLKEILPDVKHVQLTPEQMSVYARKQTQSDRICTVEAAALFLENLGESTRTTEALVDCVRINNDALKPRAKNSNFDKQSCVDPNCTGPNLYRKKENATHPCWYFGSKYFVPPAEKAIAAKEKQQQKQQERKQQRKRKATSMTNI